MVGKVSDKATGLMPVLSEQARYERDQQVQRPWGANVPGMFEEQQGDWGNWSGEVGVSMGKIVFQGWVLAAV